MAVKLRSFFDFPAAEAQGPPWRGDRNFPVSARHSRTEIARPSAARNHLPSLVSFELGKRELVGTLQTIFVLCRNGREQYRNDYINGDAILAMARSN